MKYFYLLIILFLLSGCSYMYEYHVFDFGSYKYDLQFRDKGDIDTNCELVYNWIYCNIEWKLQDRNPNIQEIMDERITDCCGQVFLMIDMLYYFYGYKASYISYDKHAYCYYNGIVYNVTSRTTYEIFDYDYKIYDFEYLNLHWNDFF